ncbi:hypothetical protein PN471_07470 [Aphanizomenon sp. CS-733/32]|uniref:hypothetical protein n=1 Tax=Aphanizomenon sp. CS-733/32 TaxID=3021715 RepID=UPI00232B403E|nr:hypothetical protein [Aphanizomenon sp. CS-733/32]MDB9308477.1 hypothetical protein [Aphanizomenon sp. CS-733/32]
MNIDTAEFTEAKLALQLYPVPLGSGICCIFKIAKWGLLNKLSVRARSQESGVRSQEEELEEDKNSIKSGKVIGFC